MSQRNLTAVLLKVLGVVSIIKAVDFAVYKCLGNLAQFGFTEYCDIQETQGEKQIVRNSYAKGD